MAVDPARPIMIPKKHYPKDLKPEKVHCNNCTKRLKPHYSYTREENPAKRSYEQDYFITGISGYGYDGLNLFCSLRCGFAWAVKVLLTANKK